MSDNNSNKENPTGSGDANPLAGIQGMIGGVVQIMEQLKGLAEHGEHLKKTVGNGEFGNGDVKGSFGYNVQVGGQSFRGPGGRGNGPSTRPFRKPASTDSALAKERETTREPHTDEFDEVDQFYVVMEMPGVGLGDVQTTLVDEQLQVRARRGAVDYLKVIALPADIDWESMSKSSNNGIIEIRFSKRAESDSHGE
ncbi:Hsp20/alpha crystallin family protein [Pirellulaceae bacterium SH501]